MVHQAAVHRSGVGDVVRAVGRPAAGGTKCAADSPFCGGDGVIERGDVLHTDVGIKYLRLNTDTQEMGYVLASG